MNYVLFSNIGIPLFALILTLLELGVFIFKKNKIDILSRIFLWCVVSSILTLSFEIICLLLLNYGYSFSNIFFRLFAFCNIFLFFLFTLYSGYLALIDMENYNNNNNLKKIYVFLIISFIISLILSLIIPFSYSCDTLNYTCSFSNPYIKISRLVALIGGIFHSILLIISKKKNKDINILSLLILFTIYCILFFYFSRNNINIDFSSACYAVSTFILFLSIENQDYLRLDDYKDINDIYLLTEKSKKNFSSNLSHFYRSRFSTILGLLSIWDLEKTNFSDSNLLKIEEANDYLFNISSSIIDISKCNSNTLYIEYIKYKISNLLNRIKSIGQGYTININIESSLEKTECYGSFDILNRVLYYLILSSSFNSNNKDINVYVEKNDINIKFTISYYNESINDIVFNKKFEEYYNDSSSNLEDYNTYLIASRDLLLNVGSKLYYINNGDNICNYTFTIPIIMDEKNKLKVKEGE